MTKDAAREIGARFHDYLIAQPRSFQIWIASAPDVESVAPVVKGALGLVALPTANDMENIEDGACDYALSLMAPEARLNAPPMGGLCVVQHRVA